MNLIRNSIKNKWYNDIIKVDNILSIFIVFMQVLLWETPEEIILALALRIKNIRKRRKISQEKLAKLSGVSFGSIKRFESTGQISLISLTRIAVSLNLQDEI